MNESVLYEYELEKLEFLNDLYSIHVKSNEVLKKKKKLLNIKFFIFLLFFFFFPQKRIRVNLILIILVKTTISNK